MNVLDALSKATGFTNAQIDEIAKDVKANMDKLESCDRHEFTIPHRKIGELVRDWRCTKCGGHVESSYKRWYERGLKHGAQK